jgi:hypothetical protein
MENTMTKRINYLHGNRRYDVNEDDVLRMIDSQYATEDVVEHFRFWMHHYENGGLSFTKRALGRVRRFIAMN